MTEKKVVILGAGIGGLATANKLRHLAPDGTKISLVDRVDTYQYQPSIIWLLNGARRPEQISAKFDRLRRRGIDVVQTDVREIDVDKRRIATTGGPLDYDFLVMALGTELEPNGIEGFADSALNVFSAEGAVEAYSELNQFTGGRVAVLISKLPYKCPAAPNEIAFLADAVLSKKGIRNESQVDLYSPEPFPMPTAGAEIGGQLREMLNSRQITFHDGKVTTSIDPGAKSIHFEDGTTAQFDLLLGIPPHLAPAAVASTGLVHDSGFVKVDRGSLETDAEGVYALGDCTQISIGGGKNLPKAGVFARSQGEVIASRVADELSGRSPSATFDGHGSCFVELGHGSAGFASGDFYGEEGPKIVMRRPGIHWHLAKVVLEKLWMRRMV